MSKRPLHSELDAAYRRKDGRYVEVTSRITDQSARDTLRLDPA